MKHKDWLLDHEARLDALENSDMEESLEDRWIEELAKLGDQMHSLKE